MRTGLKVGKISEVKEETISGEKFIKAIVTLELEKTEEILLSAPSGVNWVPTVNYDEKGNAIVTGVQVTMRLDQDQNLVFQNIRGENILEFADIDGVIVGNKVDNQGYIGDKETLLAPIHATEVRCDELRIDKSVGPGGTITGSITIQTNSGAVRLGVVS